MSFAREGYPFMGIAAALAVGALVLANARRSFVLWLLAIVLLVVALWVAYFFRDPDRTGERGERLVIAPADGLVLPIEQVDEPAFMHGRALRISIFMNVFDVHVNRYPSSGTVKYLHYNPGKFLNAANDKASLQNEQMSVGIESGRSRILVRQIAGLIARRIVTYSHEGDVATQGAKFGLIRFGSRVDIFVPLGTTIRVKPGERTRSGSTVIAELTPP